VRAGPDTLDRRFPRRACEPGCGPYALDCHFAPLDLRARDAGLVRWTVASPSWAWEPGMRA
jgi:hypothetical protein